MRRIDTPIEGLFMVAPTRYEDHRGSFMESFRADRFALIAGSEVHFVQENESRSRRNVVRGLHFQQAPYAQAKLVRVSSGRVWDVAVDLRPESATFGRWYGTELSAENGLQLFIPAGFAHGFVALSEEAVLQYKCDNYYHPESEGGIRWDDPSIAIAWPVACDEAILSERDEKHPSWNEWLEQR